MRRNLLAIAGVVALFGAAGTAAGQNQPVEQNPTMENPNDAPNECPPGMYPSGQAMPAPSTGAPTYAQPAPYAPTQYRQRRRPAFSPYQMAFSVGGGVANFARDKVNDNASYSGAWDAKLTIGTRSFFAFEAGYLGTAASAHDPIATRTITTTQVFGDARINATVWRLQPFIFGGVGWANLHRFGNVAESPVAGTNFAHNVNSVMAPVGGGIATYFGRHGMIDARGTYDFITNKDFTPARVRPDMWIAELRAGYAF